MAVLLVTHDLGIVAGRADRVLVMYAGRLVEAAPTMPLFAGPLHPYTRGLFGSIPRLDATAARLAPIPGSVPRPDQWPAGCRFHPRCPVRVEKCTRLRPPLVPVARPITRWHAGWRRRCRVTPLLQVEVSSSTIRPVDSWCVPTAGTRRGRRFVRDHAVRPSAWWVNREAERAPSVAMSSASNNRRLAPCDSRARTWRRSRRRELRSLRRECRSSSRIPSLR